MEFLVLSLPEAAYLWNGLALQATLRASSVGGLVLVVMVAWTLVLIWRHHGDEGGYLRVASYGVLCLLLVALFWPEVSRFTDRPGTLLVPEQVAAYTALHDPYAERTTAHDTADVPGSLRRQIIVPWGYRMLLRVTTRLPLALAEAFNSHAARPFDFLLSPQMLLGIEPAAQTRLGLKDWMASCYQPVMAELLSAGVTSGEDFYPWGATPMGAALKGRSVPVGASTAIPPPDALPLTLDTAPMSRCDVYLMTLTAQMALRLAEERTPAGTVLADAIEEDTGLPVNSQAALLLYRAIVQEAPAPTTTAPTLAPALYALVGAGGVGGAVSGMGSVLGMLTGGAKGVGAAFDDSVRAVRFAVLSAAFVVSATPSIVGMVQLVLITLFPLVFLWALWPGHQLEPLVHYFVALLFTSSSPLWMALIDQAARTASLLARPTVDPLGIVGPLQSAFWSSVTTVLGIFLVPVVLGSLYFASFRGVHSLWRSSL